MTVVCRLALPAQPGFNSFIHYTTDQGLSNDHVKEITKDSLGFLWLATLNGLNRFDGRTFRQFFHDPNSTNSLPENFVKNITLAPDGSLWTSSNKGICRIDPVSLEFRRILFPENRDTLENDWAGRVVFDREGKGWVCMQDGIYHFDPNSEDYEYYPIELKNAGYFDTFLDSGGRLWLIENGQISYFDTKGKRLRRFDTESPESPLYGAAFLQVKEDQFGKTWIGSWFKALLWYDPVQDSIFDFPDNDNTLARTILPDVSTDGRPLLWIGGGDYGLRVFYPETDESIDFPPDWKDPLRHNNYLAECLFKDDETDDIWIGTETGLEHYAPASIRFGRVILPVSQEFDQFSLVSDAVQDQTDPSGETFFLALWGSGFFKWNRRKGTLQHFHEDNCGLKDNQVFCIIQDRKDNFWMGNDGVSRLNPHTGKWSSWDCISPTKVNNVIMSCIEDTDGGIWFGGNNSGLFHFNPLKNTVEWVALPTDAYSAKGSLRIFNMNLDERGRIWMATNQRPIRFDPHTGKAEVFSVKNIEKHFNHWSDVHVPGNGLLYVTAHDCMVEMDTTCTALRKFNQENGLRSNQIYRVEGDREGKIWFNTTYLLHCFDPKTGQFTYYGTADGLFKNTISDALTLTANGEMFVGFQNAFNYFDPYRLRRNDEPPPVVITSMKVMNKERRPVIREIFRFNGLFSKSKLYQRDTLLVVYPKEEIFTIEFAALNFNQPSRNRFAYKLEGFNENWIYTDVNFATYTNLDGGEYLLRVKAANNDGVWNEVGTQLKVKVIPPLTERWYFFAMVGTAIGLILWGIWHYRRQQKRRLEKFRESLARDLHDEMGSTLSSIRFFGEYAKTQLEGNQSQVAAVLQRIVLSASSLSESMQDIVWAMRQNNEQLEDLGARLTEFGLRVFEAKGIVFHIQIQEGFSGKPLSPEIRRNLYLIFKEAVNNTAKYAEATEATLSLSIRKGWLFMKISDNGKGFSKTDSTGNEGGGNGLHNMRQRANEIKGHLEILTGKNIGTSVEIKVRV